MGKQKNFNLDKIVRASDTGNDSNHNGVCRIKAFLSRILRLGSKVQLAGIKRRMGCQKDFKDKSDILITYVLFTTPIVNTLTYPHTCKNRGLNGSNKYATCKIQTHMETLWQ